MRRSQRIRNEWLARLEDYFVFHQVHSNLFKSDSVVRRTRKARNDGTILIGLRGYSNSRLSNKGDFLEHSTNAFNYYKASTNTLARAHNRVDPSFVKEINSSSFFKILLLQFYRDTNSTSKLSIYRCIPYAGSLHDFRTAIKQSDKRSTNLMVTIKIPSC